MQARIEKYYSTRTDKLLHFFIMCLILQAVKPFRIWWLTLSVAIIGATVKEAIDKWYRKTGWDWEDWGYTVAAGLTNII